MKAELNISAMSNIVCMSKCPESAEFVCGINYRMS